MDRPRKTNNTRHVGPKCNLMGPICRETSLWVIKQNVPMFPNDDYIFNSNGYGSNSGLLVMIPAHLKNQRGRTPATKDLDKLNSIGDLPQPPISSRYLPDIFQMYQLPCVQQRVTVRRFALGKSPMKPWTLCLRMIHQPSLLSHRSDDIPQPVPGDVNP